jgi:putative lipoic acid-binding regulatory protein
MNPDLSELLEFPCEYGFKAFGSTTDDNFVSAVHAAVNEVTPVPLDAMKARPSSKGNYQCVTLLARVYNVEQIHAVYAALKRIDSLKYLL